MSDLAGDDLKVFGDNCLGGVLRFLKGIHGQLCYRISSLVFAMRQPVSSLAALKAGWGALTWSGVLATLNCIKLVVHVIASDFDL